eukprot:1924463-Pyramimonas_sp.AAC.1
MQQMNAPDDFGWVSVIISSVAVMQLELSTTKTESTCQYDSNNTNSFADLARVADRIQTSWMQQTNAPDHSKRDS